MFSHINERVFMVNTINQANRPVAVLNLPKKSVHGLITHATRVVKAMTANPVFPVPVPALATVMAAVADLRDADAKVAERIPDAIVTRDARRAALVTLLQSLRMHVQVVADGRAPAGAAVIEGAGLAGKRIGDRPPRIFAALAGLARGTVKLIAPTAGRRASYNWQYSLDGETWIELPSTLQATTTLTGQVPGTVLRFRYRSVTRTGETEWSAPVTFTVRAS